MIKLKIKYLSASEMKD